MIRIRVSHLESFRRIVATEYGDEPGLIASLRGQPPEPNWAMLRGSAWHRLLEQDHVPGVREAMCRAKRDVGNTYPTEDVADAVAHMMGASTSAHIEPFHCPACGQWHVGKPGDDEERMGKVRCGQWSFDRSAWLDAKALRGPGLCEVPASITLGGAVVYSEGCDHIRGKFIRDAKTICDAPDARRYEDSCQWRFYLVLHDAAAFTFDLFHFGDPDDDGHSVLKATASVRFWRYPGLEAECSQWVRRFRAWAEDRGLTREAA